MELEASLHSLSFQLISIIFAFLGSNYSIFHFENGSEKDHMSLNRTRLASFRVTRSKRGVPRDNILGFQLVSKFLNFSLRFEEV